MNTQLPFFLARAVLLATSFAIAPGLASQKTALDRYVAAPDSHYKYELANVIPGDGYTAYVLDMTSQQWRDPSVLDHSIWKHWLTIVKPAQVSSTTALLFITGGSVTAKAPAQPDPMLVTMAQATHSVTAELRGVPNEPVTFNGETKTRSEDAIIAYTWDKYLRGGDDNWPLRLPMTKAAVRAMDTVTDFCKGDAAGHVAVDKFMVSGASKRGWTTWTTAAVDKRVIAIAPLVIDMLNIEPSFTHHYQAYGFWAPSVQDYQDLHIMDWTGSPRYRELMKIEEPYSYRERLTMPKFMMNAAGDQFFLPDSSQFYFDALKGEKYLRYVPNTSHNLANSDAHESLAAFYESVVEHSARPKFKWKFEKDGSTRVESETHPTKVLLWQANDPKARDFRLDTIGAAYTSSPLEDGGHGVYVGKVAKPPAGWTAYFIEMTYPGPGKYPYKFTTGVRVVPDTLPFGPPPKKPVPPPQ